MRLLKVKTLKLGETDEQEDQGSHSPPCDKLFDPKKDKPLFGSKEPLKTRLSYNMSPCRGNQSVSGDTHKIGT